MLNRQSCRQRLFTRMICSGIKSNPYRLGSTRDIVEECGVARFLFTDFPLGNSAGKPLDIDMQQSILGMALDLLEQAWMPRTTIQTPCQWPDEQWREAFMKIDDSNREALAREEKERRELQAGMKKSR